jgi:[ribosomal protein S18]-alanine N-acetyltransferase
VIRRATADDALAVARIEGLTAPGSWPLPTVARHLARPTSLSLVVSWQGRVTGHLLSTCVVDEAEILTLAVHPAARRRGLGARLVTAAQAAWIRRGVSAAFLEVRVDNTAARALYQSTGWSEAGVRPRYYRDGTDALVLRWAPPSGRTEPVGGPGGAGGTSRSGGTPRTGALSAPRTAPSS